MNPPKEPINKIGIGTTDPFDSNQGLIKLSERPTKSIQMVNAVAVKELNEVHAYMITPSVTGNNPI